MCGVFGFITRSGRPVNLGVLTRLAKVTERRGPHAWGLAWIDGRGVLHAYKQTGRVTDSLGLLALAWDARYLIGHCRYATHGDPGNNLNNPPHACDSGWLVHNGQVPGHETLCHRHGLYPVTDCDSEVLALLVERAAGTLAARVAAAVATPWPPAPLVLLGLWKPGTVVAARAGNPLHRGATAGGVYLASLAEGLPGRVRPVPDGRVLVLGRQPAEEVSCGT